MTTSNDISILIVTAANSLPRLELVYKSIRSQYPDNEIVVVYDNIDKKLLPLDDPNLIQVTTDRRVYVSIGYNLAVKHSTKPCFVFLHDDTVPAPNFLENIAPHLTDKMFVNFSIVEPPKFGNESTIQYPVRNFGLTDSDFDQAAFNNFCEKHIQNLPHKQEPSLFGGFFLAGFKSSFLSVGGFDESFQPYFFEDSDLMTRLHLAGFRFTLVLDSIIYHMGSLTSRGTEESIQAHKTTHDIFLKKWKTTFEVIKRFTMLDGLDYQKTSLSINLTNPTDHIKHLAGLFHEEDGAYQVDIDGNSFSQQDVDNLILFPYILRDIERGHTYEIGNLKVKLK